MQARGLDAQQIFMTATLMCVIWLASLTMLVRQAEFSDFGVHRSSLTIGQSLALLAPFQLLGARTIH
jgi:hypothetical protein